VLLTPYRSRINSANVGAGQNELFLRLCGFSRSRCSKFNKGGAVQVTLEKVKKILIDQLDVDEGDISMESSITDDLGADSLDVVDMVMSLEEEFDIEIPDDEIETMKTVGDIVKFIETKSE